MVMQTITGRRTRQELIFLFAAVLGICYLVASIVDLLAHTVTLGTWVFLAIAFQCLLPGVVGLHASLLRYDPRVRGMLYPVGFGYTTVLIMYLVTLVNPQTSIPVFLTAMVITVCCGAIAEIGYRLSAFRSGDADRTRLNKFWQFMEEQSERESEMKQRLASEGGTS